MLSRQDQRRPVGSDGVVGGARPWGSSSPYGRRKGKGKGRLWPGATESASYLPRKHVDTEIACRLSTHRGCGTHVHLSSSSNQGAENRDTQRSPLTLGLESTGHLVWTEPELPGEMAGSRVVKTEDDRVRAEPGGLHGSLQSSGSH